MYGKRKFRYRYLNPTPTYSSFYGIALVQLVFSKQRAEIKRLFKKQDSSNRGSMRERGEGEGKGETGIKRERDGGGRDGN